MTKEERRSYWKAIVDEQIQSGLSAPSFCREHHLKVSQFYWWRRRFQKQTPMGSSDGFIELIPSSKGSGSGIRIRLFDELCIEVDRGFDPFTLRAAVETLYSKGSKPCSP
ncbi:MAG: hypothetical protein ACE5I0_07250 [Candidatus Binatia bacterium]